MTQWKTLFFNCLKNQFPHRSLKTHRLASESCRRRLKDQRSSDHPSCRSVDAELHAASDQDSWQRLPVARRAQRKSAAPLSLLPLLQLQHQPYPSQPPRGTTAFFELNDSSQWRSSCFYIFFPKRITTAAADLRPIGTWEHGRTMEKDRLFIFKGGIEMVHWMNSRWACFDV